ncbi:MAG: hypothetical protein ABW321_07345 [Polyangiales bacterium]
MMRLSKRYGVVLGAASCLGAALWMGRVLASGVPAKRALTYSGILQNADGTALSGSHTIEVNFWGSAKPEQDATPLCQTPSVPYELNASGRFAIALPEPCTQAAQEHADLWVNVLVDGRSLGLVKLGAVPYALEAAHAESADQVRSGTPLDTRLNALMPPKSVVSAYLNAEEIAASFDETGLGLKESVYAGWAICNGQNGTPDLAGRFVRSSTQGAGATGGDDNVGHTHPIDHDHDVFSCSPEGEHTHQTPAHQHVLPIGFDNGVAYFTAGADIGPIFGSEVRTEWRSALGVAGFEVAATRMAWTENAGSGTSGPGTPHAHVIDVPPHVGSSGPSSVTDNRPAFIELVPLMRL